MSYFNFSLFYICRRLIFLLRALYFFLAKIVEKFYALQYGIGILLIFIGLKLLSSEK